MQYAEVISEFMDIGALIDSVEKFFDGDTVKTMLWFNTKNPMLGDMTPIELIQLGKYQKVKEFIVSSLSL
jgi:hypothetical protein